MATAPAGVAAVLSPLYGRDFLSSADFSANETAALLDLAAQLKSGDRRIDLGNRVLGLIFSKASTRTRVSFQVAMARLGGQTVDLNPSLTQLGRGEPLEDTSRVLSRYCDVLAIRTFAQQELVDYAHWATVPVINALTDLEHPCQALADFLTMQEAHGALPGQTLAYVGDGNNVAHSLMLCGALLGVNVRIGCPEGFEPLPGVLEQARSLAQQGASIDVVTDPREAVAGAQAVYTDVWASMGQEAEQMQREQAFAGFCVDQALMDLASSEAIVLHCLPAHRGEEISAEVMEGTASRIFDQAENRLHAQQALLAVLMGGL
ncbi:ornithine carbamoyltransferase [Synechococcus sp. HB1133]|uniref:ornithine carbamoyltransferase n=1 Tax=unclassified Synechococcus TaxID=2626047 RepID=UPI00140CEAAC|nr:MULTISPECIES: ornithine carbamoyltransferase [unclassified Synechococcus]MCB4393709.1 ornithine carbamoyltransferase [Synechococcus sp. PH41509]MCB4422112.1 ornithine carbamoyltransferase [Synechococcus sp. HB1133]MCB4429941.1 ornithine carbamoyltransferase [Synechococcus sp. HBA1120]NHI81055.1 ornithine carbamoyltransferase [Synechococcus sp. HB1133]